MFFKRSNALDKLIMLLLGFFVLSWVLIISLNFIAQYHEARALPPSHPEPENSFSAVPAGHAAGNAEEPLNNLPVLMYHHITEEPERFQAATVTPDQFEEDMRHLKNLGFTTITTQDVIHYLNDHQPLPDQPVMVTIDDGYSSVYSYAYPILKELDLKAVVNIIGISVGRSTHLYEGSPIIPHFTWEQAKRMQQSGHVDIQSHSFDLHHLEKKQRLKQAKGTLKLDNESPNEYAERFKKDVLRNQQFIQEHLGHPVVLYSYPYGLYNEQTEKILKEIGYIISLTIEPGMAEVDNDFMQLRRFNMAVNKSSRQKFNEIIQQLQQE